MMAALAISLYRRFGERRDERMQAHIAVGDPQRSICFHSALFAAEPSVTPGRP